MGENFYDKMRWGLRDFMIEIDDDDNDKIIIMVLRIKVLNIY